jgi:hypothetical protein
MLPGYIGDVILAAVTFGTVSYLAYMYLSTAAEADTSFAGDVPDDFSGEPDKDIDLTMGDIYADMASEMAEKDTDPGVAGLMPEIPSPSP